MDSYLVYSFLFHFLLTVIDAGSSTSTTTPSYSDLTEEHSHYGTEFYLGMTNNQIEGSRTLHIASERAGTFQVQVPIIKIDEEVVLLKGYTIYKINVTFPWRMNAYISSSVPVAITVVDVNGDSSYSAFLALPVTFAGTSFMTSGAKGWYYGIAVMAIYDNTDVTLEDLDNKTETATLDRLGLFSTRDYPDMTGMTVSANKPVTVNSGTTKHAPTASGMSIEQMLPLQTWTNRFIVPPLSTKSKYSIRTLTMETQNVCFKNSTSQKCLQITKADSNSTFTFGTEPVEITSSSQLSVIQYPVNLNGRFGSSDVFMIVIPGVKNYLNMYSFVIPNTPNINAYIVVIVLSSEANRILLDGSLVTYDTVQNISLSIGKYSVLKKTVTQGYHELRHGNTQVRFGALAYGFNGRESYAFPLGFAYVRPVNDSNSGWSEWSSCTVTCGDGFRTRTRPCDRQSQLFMENGCNGEDTQSQTCFSQACRVNDSHSGWSDWSVCTLTCGEGFQTRTRPCDIQSQLFMENGCNGEDTQSQTCFSQACRDTPYGLVCNPERDHCQGFDSVCLDGKCRCLPDHYYDGENCLSMTNICPAYSGENTEGKTAIIVGAIMGVVIVALAVYAIYITVLLARKSNGTGTIDPRQHRPEVSNQGDFNSGAGVPKDVHYTAGSQYMTLDRKNDPNNTYDVIQGR